MKIRYGIIALCMLLCSTTNVAAELSIGIGFPSVSIGINLPLFPELVRVPGYPVYYAPRIDANYFFHDGMYWVYQDDNWYASSWYNGPWVYVEPEVVPLFILRIPVRYYRQPPVYFSDWHANAPPRWGQHWGHDWEQRRSGWDKWKRGSAPAPAPLPVYQRKYSGDKYPRVEQQQTLRSKQYRYQPRDKVVRQHIKQIEQRSPAPVQQRKLETPAIRSQNGQEASHSTPLRQRSPAPQRSQPTSQPPPQQRTSAVQEQRQQPGAGHREQQAPRPQVREQRAPERGMSQEPGQDRGQGQNKDEDRGRGREK